VTTSFVERGDIEAGDHHVVVALVDGLIAVDQLAALVGVESIALGRDIASVDVVELGLRLRGGQTGSGRLGARLRAGVTSRLRRDAGGREANEGSSDPELECSHVSRDNVLARVWVGPEPRQDKANEKGGTVDRAALAWVLRLGLIGLLLGCSRGCGRSIGLLFGAGLARGGGLLLHLEQPLAPLL